MPTCIVAALSKHRQELRRQHPEVIQSIHHPVRMPELLDMTKFGDAESKGEGFHCFTDMVCCVKGCTSLRPDGPKGFGALLSTVTQAQGRSPVSRDPLQILWDLGSFWRRTERLAHDGWALLYYLYVLTVRA